MVALAAHAALTAEQSFRDRVKAAAVQTALQVSGETGGAEISYKSALRQNYAALILAGTVDYQSVVWAVAANGTILGAYTAGAVEAHPAWDPPVVGKAGDPDGISDSDIEYVLTTVWDDLCGSARVEDQPAAPVAL